MIQGVVLGGVILLAVAPVRNDRDVKAFLARHCVSCHGPTRKKAKLRLDTLGLDFGKKEAASTWKSVLERLELGDMPPEDEPQPRRADVERVVSHLRRALKSAGHSAGGKQQFPHFGNALPHDRLFGSPGEGAPATRSRLWRLSPYGYREFIDGLTQTQIRQGRRAVIVLPYGLTTEPEFRDYAFRYAISGSEAEQMALNARLCVTHMFDRHGRHAAPKELSSIARAKTPPSREDLLTAVNYLFDQVLLRKPTREEQKRYVDFAARNVKRSGNRSGLARGLAPVLLHPEAVFRVELGRGGGGRAMLAPRELAFAIAYALTDKRPDRELRNALDEGRLKTRADVRREAERLLGDDAIAKPRILRFFQEYFGYTRAPDIFKDDYIIRDAGFANAYRPGWLVEDTDNLVLHVLNQDRQVLRELLTTEQSFVSSTTLANWLKFRPRREVKAKKDGVPPPTHPFNKQQRINQHYNLDGKDWSEAMPMPLPTGQRAGILTQPSWLIAHSTNTDNHAILRGKWIRYRLLGGRLPDTPVTVDAQLPEEPKETLRHRMRVTREEFCWKCHRKMDPLGLPFETFDHFGRFRTTEKGGPVDASGAIVGSGDPALDGKVGNAVEMIRKLARSEHVEEVFVRHAFRYWMGRNETLEDASTLQAAHRAYAAHDGSMKALILSLLTSDSFLYRN